MMLKRTVFASLLLVFLLSVAVTESAVPGLTSSSKAAIYYSDPTSYMSTLYKMKVVAIEPKSTTPRQVSLLKQAGVTVFCYISLGEDVIEPVKTNTGKGPVTWDQNGNSFTPRYTNGGWPSWSLDYSWQNGSQKYAADGTLDRNPYWNGLFVYPNDDWKNVLKTQRIQDGSRNLAGLDQIFGAADKNKLDNKNSNYECDGAFLDTVDVAGPYEKSVGYYPLLAGPYSDLIKWIKTTYPAKLLWLNRAVFYFNPYVSSSYFNVRAFDYNPAGSIDLLLYESFTLDFSAKVPNEYFVDNYCNYAPKINALAAVYGFQVLTLEYLSGKDTSAINLAAGYDQGLGWTTIISSGGSLSTMPIDISTFSSTAGPTWMSSGGSFFECLASRKGTQSVGLSGYGDLVSVRFDTAAGAQAITYLIDQVDASGKLLGAATVLASANQSTKLRIFKPWSSNPASNPAFEARLPLPSAQTVYYRTRVRDSAGSTDTNTAAVQFQRVYTISNPVSTITVDGNTNEWDSLNFFTDLISIAHDDSNLYFKLPSGVDSIYIQTDATQGFNVTAKAPFNVNYKINITTGQLFKIVTTPSGTWYNLVSLYRGSRASSAVVSGQETMNELSISLSNFVKKVFRVYFHNSVSGRYAPDKSISFFYDTRPMLSTSVKRNYFGSGLINPITVDGNHTEWTSLSLFLNPYDSPLLPVPGSSKGQAPHIFGAAHNNSLLYIAASYPYNKVFISTSAATNKSYNYQSMAIFANIMVENDYLYQYTGSGQDWSWKSLGQVSKYYKNPANNFTEIGLSLSLLNSTSQIKIVFSDNSVGYWFPPKPYFFTYDLSSKLPSNKITAPSTAPYLSIAHDDTYFYVSYTYGQTLAASAYPYTGSDWTPGGNGPISPTNQFLWNYLFGTSGSTVYKSWTAVENCKYTKVQGIITFICHRSTFGAQATGEAEIDFLLFPNVKDNVNTVLVRYTTARLATYPAGLYSNEIKVVNTTPKKWTAFHDNSFVWIKPDSSMTDHFLMPSNVLANTVLYQSWVYATGIKFLYYFGGDFFKYNGDGSSWSFKQLLSNIRSDPVDDKNQWHMIPRIQMDMQNAGTIKYSSWKQESSGYSTYPAGGASIIEYQLS